MLEFSHFDSNKWPGSIAFTTETIQATAGSQLHTLEMCVFSAYSVVADTSELGTNGKCGSYARHGRTTERTQPYIDGLHDESEDGTKSNLPFIHLLIDLRTHSLIHSLTHSLTHTLTHPLIHSHHSQREPCAPAVAAASAALLRIALPLSAASTAACSASRRGGVRLGEYIAIVVRTARHSDSIKL